jgi:hypothetical protein
LPKTTGKPPQCRISTNVALPSRKRRLPFLTKVRAYSKDLHMMLRPVPRNVVAKDKRERCRRLLGRAAPILLGGGPPVAIHSEIYRSSFGRAKHRAAILERRGKPIYLGAVGFDLLTARIDDLEACQAAFCRQERTNQQLANLQHRNGKPLLEAWIIVAEREFAEIYYQTFHARLARRALRAYFERQLASRRRPSHPVSYSGPRSIHHLFRVACGLHSATPLETEVHGVLRRALVKASMNQTLSFSLEQVFHTALAVADRVRKSDTQRASAPESIDALIRLAVTRIPRFASCCFAILMELPWAMAVQRLLISHGVGTARILRHDARQGGRWAENLLSPVIVKAHGAPLYLVLIVDGSKGTPRLSQGRLRALLNAGVAWIWVLDAGIPRALPAAAATLHSVTVWDLTALINAQPQDAAHQADIAAVRTRLAQLADAYPACYSARPTQL